MNPMGKVVHTKVLRFASQRSSHHRMARRRKLEKAAWGPNLKNLRQKFLYMGVEPKIGGFSPKMDGLVGGFNPSEKY